MPRYMALLVLLGSVPWALAQEKLPTGAIARLGDPTFRSGETAFALSPDGKSVAAAEPGSVRLFDAETWKEMRRLDLPTRLRVFRNEAEEETTRWRPIQQLQFDSVGRRIMARATGNNQEFLIVWNAESPKTERLISLSNARAGRLTPVSTNLRFSVAFGPEMKKGGGVDGYGTHVTDHETGQTFSMVKNLPGEWARNLALSPDGSRIAGWADRDSPIAPRPPGEPSERTDPFADKFEFSVWEVATGKEVGKVKVRQPPKEVVFSPDGRSVAVQYGYEDERVIWDLTAGKAVCRFAPREGSGPTFFLGNDSIGIVSRGGVFQRREIAGGRLTQVVDGPAAESDQLTVAAVARPDGSVRLCGRLGAAFLIWDVAKDGTKPARTFGKLDGPSRPPVGIAFLQDGKTLRTLSEDGAVLLWDLATRRLLDRLQITGPKVQYPQPALPWLSADGRFAYFPASNRVRIWDLDRRLDLGTVAQGRPISTVLPDGRILDRSPGASGPLREIKLPEGRTPVASGVSADGRLGAMACENRNVAERRDRQELLIYDLATKELLKTIKTESYLYQGQLSFSPDNRCVIVADDRGVSVWDWRRGSRLSTTYLPRTAPAFSADARLMARVITDYVQSQGVEVRELASGGVRLSFPIGGPGTVAFAPDSKTLAASAPDATILLWDISRPTGTEPAKKWDAAGGDAIWGGLADPDAAHGYAHMCRLIAFPEEAVALIRERTRPVDLAAEITKQIRRLDDDDLRVREAATRELAQLGENAEEPIRKALAGDLSPEARRRLEFLISDLKTNAHLPTIRPTRVVEVLERIATPAARAALEEFARRDGSTVLTTEAKAVLARIEAKNK